MRFSLDKINSFGKYSECQYVNIYLGIGHLRTEIKRRKRRRRERRRRGGKERGGRGERVVSIFSLVEGERRYNHHIF